MPDTRHVSPCCGAPFRPNVDNHPGEGVTRWYECTACGQPCNPMDADLYERMRVKFVREGMERALSLCLGMYTGGACCAAIRAAMDWEK